MFGGEFVATVFDKRDFVRVKINDHVNIFTAAPKSFIVGREWRRRRRRRRRRWWRRSREQRRRVRRDSHVSIIKIETWSGRRRRRRCHGCAQILAQKTYTTLVHWFRHWWLFANEVKFIICRFLKQKMFLFSFYLDFLLIFCEKLFVVVCLNTSKS